MTDTPVKPQNTNKPKINSIVLYPRPHTDTIVAVLLLKEYGINEYENIDKANLLFWTAPPQGKTEEQLLQEGCLLVDIGGGKFDHHDTKDSVSRLVAKGLGIERLPELQKMLKWAERDEKKGQGTISKDQLDRAFGFSGLIMSLHRTYLKTPEMVYNIALPVLQAHLSQEKRRFYDLPQEWADAQSTGKAQIYQMKHGNQELTVVMIETASMDIVGFLRNYKKTRADIVIQALPSGHINIITKQNTKIQLADVIRILRTEEARKKKIDLGHPSSKDLSKPERLEKVPEWFYDTAANTVQNGGVIPESTPPTVLAPQEVVNAVFVGLDKDLFEKTCEGKQCRTTDCYFYEYQLPRCIQRREQE